MVYLAGKDESGKTVYVEEDGTPHLHKTNRFFNCSNNCRTYYNFT
jgi:hypothetical protein